MARNLFNEIAGGISALGDMRKNAQEQKMINAAEVICASLENKQNVNAVMMWELRDEIDAYGQPSEELGGAFDVIEDVCKTLEHPTKSISRRQTIALREAIETFKAAK